MKFRRVLTSMMVTCLACCFVSWTHGDMINDPVVSDIVRASQQHSERHFVSSKASAELAIVGENLLAYGANGSHNLRRVTGESVWSIKCIIDEAYGAVDPWGVVATSSGVAYVSSPPGYAYVLLRRPDDGSVVWEAKLAERGINYIRELVYSPKTASIIAVGDGNVPRWHSVLFSIREGTGQFRKVEIPGKGILDACLLSDGRVALSGSEFVGIYDLEENTFTSLSESLGYSWAVAQFDEERIVVSSATWLGATVAPLTGEDFGAFDLVEEPTRSVKLINIVSKDVEWSVTLDGLIQALITLPDGTIVAGGQGTLYYIQTENARPAKIVSINHGGYIRDIEYDPKRYRLYIASSTGVSYYTRQPPNKAIDSDKK